MDKLSYQQTYGILQVEMNSLFSDWPVPMPPRLHIIHHKSPEVKTDPRGDTTLMTMRSSALVYTKEKRGIPLVVPTDNVLRVFHPAMEALILNTYGGQMSFGSGVREVFGDLLHEMFHYITLVRSYTRALKHSFTDNAWFAADLYANQLDNIIGSPMDEYRNEQYTIRTLLAWLFDRGPISIDDIYDNTLMLPSPDGPFFQSFLKDTTVPNYSLMLHISYRYHYNEAAFGPERNREYHRKMIRVRTKEIQKLAKVSNEEYGKTWRLWDEYEE